MQLLEFIPLYMERIWGGRNIESKLGRTLPEEKTIGESWDIVDRTEAQSIICNGTLAGLTLREVLERSADAILGPNSDPQKPFPIFVKWLDCHQRLSLQVHPTAEAAASLGGEPKTEYWYIADASAEASLMVGLREGVTRKYFETVLAEGRIEDCVQPCPTQVGDSVLVESGCVHAIGAGNLILEIQQNSDTTYRIHDWDRVGLEGVPRQLHHNESLQSIDFNQPKPTLLKSRPGEQLLTDCNEFRIRKFDSTPDDTPLCLPSGEGARLIHIISGTLSDPSSGQVLTCSNSYLQPYITDLTLVAETAATVLITDRF